MKLNLDFCRSICVKMYKSVENQPKYGQKRCKKVPAVRDEPLRRQASRLGFESY